METDGRHEQISQITMKFMDAIGETSIRPFTMELNRPLVVAGLAGFSHQTVHNWLSMRSIPGDKMKMLQLCTSEFPQSWQHQFANAILNAISQPA